LATKPSPIGNDNPRCQPGQSPPDRRRKCDALVSMDQSGCTSAAGPARRKFVDAAKVNPQYGEAAKIVVRTGALFLVDSNVREQRLTGTERLGPRREHLRRIRRSTIPPVRFMRSNV
jgi:hypothetical protein